MHENVLAYKHGRYMWLASILSVASVAAYMVHAPIAGPNGGTWLGYTLGILAVLIIVLLTFFGVRKRSYQSNLGKVEGWLSAHIYLGLSLLVIATLHTGFQFGWNIHTLAYVFMVLVILSGLFGVYAYLRYPRLMSFNRESLTQDVMLEEIEAINQKVVKLADTLGQHYHALIVSSVERTVVGGSALTQLFGRDNSVVVVPPEFNRAHVSGQVVDNGEQQVVMSILLDEMTQTTDSEKIQTLKDLANLIGQKKIFLKKLRKDIQMQGALEIWLYFHIPLTFCLLAALIAHIVSVFFYW